jgi:hypothetical protein
MFSEHAESFAGLQVVEFEGPRDWRGPALAYRVREEYEDETHVTEKLKTLLAQRDGGKLTTLVIGSWQEPAQNDSAGVIDELVKNASRLPDLRAVFLGDITYEEAEISWIKQCDMTALLRAFPKLEVLRVRGGEGLAFSTTKHDSLHDLTVETGGLRRATIREIFLCGFPNLERLQLLLGEEHYGFDANVDDLVPVLSGRLYPRLRYLGLCDSVIADEIAAVAVNSPIVRRLEVLDLSMGNLTEQGARSLLRLPGGSLKRLDISHHYVPQGVIDELRRTLPFEVVADDPQDPNDEWRPILHAE